MLPLRSSIMWGLGIGAASAALGVVGLVLGALIEPIPQQTTADGVVAALFIRGMIAILTLGVALGLAYYSGNRVATAAEAAGETQESPLRYKAAIAGGLVMACYWLLTSVTIVLQGGADARTASVLTWRVVFGVLFVVIGAGLGGLGARTVIAQRLIRAAISPVQPPTSAPLVDDNTSTR